jgi:hypothetical protein
MSSVAELYEQVKDEAHEAIAEAAGFVAMNSLGFREAMAEFGISLVADFMSLVQQQVGATGADKKAAVLKLAADFYDEVIAPIDLPGPDVIIDPLLRAAWLKGLDLTIEGLLAWLKSTTVDGVLATFRKSA